MSSNELTDGADEVAQTLMLSSNFWRNQLREAFVVLAPGLHTYSRAPLPDVKRANDLPLFYEPSSFSLEDAAVEDVEFVEVEDNSGW